MKLSLSLILYFCSLVSSNFILAYSSVYDSSSSLLKLYFAEQLSKSEQGWTEVISILEFYINKMSSTFWLIVEKEFWEILNRIGWHLRWSSDILSKNKSVDML